MGGAIGSQVGNEGNRPVAILVGAVLGAIVGNKIGSEIDNGDRGCMGHALELAGEKNPVRWTNGATGLSYTLTPTRNFGDVKQPCREFTTTVSTAGKKKKRKDESAPVKGVACRKGNGEWEIRS